MGQSVFVRGDEATRRNVRLKALCCTEGKRTRLLDQQEMCTIMTPTPGGARPWLHSRRLPSFLYGMLRQTTAERFRFTQPAQPPADDTQLRDSNAMSQFRFGLLQSQHHWDMHALLVDARETRYHPDDKLRTDRGPCAPLLPCACIWLHAPKTCTIIRARDCVLV